MNWGWSKSQVAQKPSRLRVGALRVRRGQTGATLFEYAVVSMIFFTVLFGICGFGYMLFIYHLINNTAKEATRYAAVRGSTCSQDADGGSCQSSNSASGISGPTTAADIQAFANKMLVGVDVNMVNVPSTGSDGSGATYFCGVSGSACTPAVASAAAACNAAATANQPGCTVKVTVAYAFNFLFPLLPVYTTTTAPCSKPGLCLYSTSQMVIVH